jgi:hypothetical protein
MADTNPDVVVGNCKAVTDAIRDIYAQDMTNIIFGDLYRCIDRSSPSTLSSKKISLYPPDPSG